MSRHSSDISHEREFLARTAPDTDPLGIGRGLRELLGPGSGICLEIACGTGVHVGRVRELGWLPASIEALGRPQ